MIRKKRKKRINRARSHSIGQSKGLGGGSASEAERKVIRMAGMEVSLDVEGGKLREHKPFPWKNDGDRLLYPFKGGGHDS